MALVAKRGSDLHCGSVGGRSSSSGVWKRQPAAVGQGYRIRATKAPQLSPASEASSSTFDALVVVEPEVFAAVSG